MTRNSVRNAIGALVLGLGLAVVPRVANAITINFDDLSTPGAFIPNGYQGLDWSNFRTNPGAGTPLSGYDNGTISPPNIAYNSGGTPANFSISDPNVFTLTSGYFTAAWNDGLAILVTAFLDSSLIYITSFNVDTQRPLFVLFDWANIDRVNFNSVGGVHNDDLEGFGTHFVLDDLTINQVSAVPEPATLALFGAGLLGLAAIRRRRKAKA